MLAVSLLIAASDLISYCLLSLCCFLSDKTNFFTVFLMPSILTPCCCPSMVLKFATFLLGILVAFLVCILLVLAFIFSALAVLNSVFLLGLWIPTLTPCSQHGGSGMQSTIANQRLQVKQFVGLYSRKAMVEHNHNHTINNIYSILQSKGVNNIYNHF